MKLQEWERDIINRQRNIVFPDTLLNEARFYRNLISGSTPLKLVRVIGVLLVAAPYFLTGCISLALLIGYLRTIQDPFERWISLATVFGALGPLGFGAIILVRGLVRPPLPAAKRRPGYRKPRG
jgi:hypothetical protein